MSNLYDRSIILSEIWDISVRFGMLVWWYCRYSVLSFPSVMIPNDTMRHSMYRRCKQREREWKKNKKPKERYFSRSCGRSKRERERVGLRLAWRNEKDWGEGLTKGGSGTKGPDIRGQKGQIPQLSDSGVPSFTRRSQNHRSYDRVWHSTSTFKRPPHPPLIELWRRERGIHRR